MHMAVDEARCHDQAGQVLNRFRIGEGTRFMHACDHRSDNADIGRPDFHRRDIGNARAAQEQVERRPPLRGLDRALADLERNRLQHGYSALILAAFTSAENFAFSAFRNSANSFGELPTGIRFAADPSSDEAYALVRAATAKQILAMLTSKGDGAQVACHAVEEGRG